jgi:hypothetical protein
MVIQWSDLLFDCIVSVVLHKLILICVVLVLFMLTATRLFFVFSFRSLVVLFWECWDLQVGSKRVQNTRMKWTRWRCVRRCWSARETINAINDSQVSHQWVFEDLFIERSKVTIIMYIISLPNHYIISLYTFMIYSCLCARPIAGHTCPCWVSFVLQPPTILQPPARLGGDLATSIWLSVDQASG